MFVFVCVGIVIVHYKSVRSGVCIRVFDTMDLDEKFRLGLDLFSEKKNLTQGCISITSQ